MKIDREIGQNGLAKKLYRSYLSPPRTSGLIFSTLGELLEEASNKWGSRDFFHDVPSGRRLTFQQVKDDVDLLASGFLQLGLRRGDRLGIWGLNSPEWALTYLAAAQIGVIIVPLSSGYEAPELCFALNYVAIKTLVIGQSYRNRNYHKTLMEATNPCGDEKSKTIQSSTVPNLETVICMSEEASEKYFWTLSGIKNLGSNEKAMALMKESCEKVQCDDILQLPPTSGTTGRPKFVSNSHHGVINSTFSGGKHANFCPEDKYCLTLPFCHALATVVGIFFPLHFGSSTVFPSPVFSPRAAMETADRERCTFICGTPTMHQDMLNLPNFQDFDLSSAVGAITGGAPLPAPLVTRMKEKYGISDIINVYGSTEAYIITITRAGDNHEVLAKSVGYPLDTGETKIIDTQGSIVPIGAVGQVCFRGVSVMHGYWNEPEKTAQAIDSSRWYQTGDLGFMRESGHITIVGRQTDMLLRGGENIYPKEIEEFLEKQPGIAEVHVFGVPDERLGEVVAAWILPTSAVAVNSSSCGDSSSSPSSIVVDLDYIRNVCQGQISRAKIPVFVKILSSRSEIPQTTNGKTPKKAMRQIFSEELNLL